MKIPEEPKNIKAEIEARRKKLGGYLSVWYGSPISSHLWTEWKEELKEKGFTWQKFQKLMSHYTDEMIQWSRGQMSWESLVEKILESIKS